MIDITDAWQHIPIGGAFARPIVFCGVLTRQSTAQAVVRTQNVMMDSSGKWSFEVRAEQKSCHFAKPPPTAERVSYLVVEAGISEDGLQAGVIRIRDREWHRVSLLRHLEPDASGSVSAPVVISHVQNFDNRTKFLTTRHHLVPTPRPVGIAAHPYHTFFVQVQEGEGFWCPNGHYYAEYFDNLDLGGTPVVAVCEPTRPDWHWHAWCGGVPPIMGARVRGARGSALFSTRWTFRLSVEKQEARLTFSSMDSSIGGSRIVLDGTTVLDKWEVHPDGRFTSDLVTVGEGYHILKCGIENL
jgi:hypothetical protein